MSIAQRALATVHPLKQRSKPMESEAALPNGRTPEQWAEIIRGKWQGNVKSIFEIALYLETAKDELGADFPRMYREELKWSKTTVSQLLTIASCDHFAEFDVSNLPASWATLYALAKLTPAEFAKGVESGIIHAGMERKDIRDLKPPKEKAKPPPEPELKGADLIKRRTFETRQVIVSAMRDMSPEEQAEFFAMIRLQLEDIESRKKAA